MVRVDAYFFRNGGQNSPFSKIARYVWTRPKPTGFFFVVFAVVAVVIV